MKMFLKKFTTWNPSQNDKSQTADQIEIHNFEFWCWCNDGSVTSIFSRVEIEDARVSFNKKYKKLKSWWWKKSWLFLMHETSRKLCKSTF